jgi:uncharacterized repeat protein (TIGR01451 family)
MVSLRKRLLESVLALTAGLVVALLVFLWAGSAPAPVRAKAEAPPAPQPSYLSSLNPISPTTPVRLIFIHHSTGQNWLSDDDGGLAIALRANNYFVSDTNYGWGPADLDKGYERIGDHTDIPDWYSWFTGPHRDTYLAALYAESGQTFEYSRLASNPGGENQIIMFKSCFPNSALGGNYDDPPAPSANYASALTVANAKRIYLDLLSYFRTRQDKLFVVITAPPLASLETDLTQAANARAFNNWLVNNWLADYPYNNVAVFDFYNVLSSNLSGNPNTNDLEQINGNHHRWWDGAIQHLQTETQPDDNYSAYPTSNIPSDVNSHPSRAGNLKATGEFLPLLNIYYHLWQEGASQKAASVQVPQHGDVVTYTVVVRGLAAPLTATVYLTDALPSGVTYMPGTLSATVGTTGAVPPTLTWTGTLSPATAVTITYAVTVSASDPQVITNSALIAVPGYETLTRTATMRANWLSVYLPLVRKR